MPPEEGLCVGSYQTPWGSGRVACRDGRLVRIWLPGSAPPDVLESARGGGGDACAGACRQLEEYFRGERGSFDLEPDLSGASPFSAAVLRAAMRIPWGDVRTYGWLAAEAGRPGAARACGQVMARNPFPVVIPCHRVVAANGGAGGYSAGLHWKQRLLALEGFDLALPPGACPGAGDRE
jgi:methylated-DNA-[protein]-cysteine S-methyltransferase